MHPTLARFLDLAAARRTLERAERGETLDAAERALVRVAQRASDQRQQLGKGAGSGAASSSAQRAGLYLALHAAAESVREDPELAEAWETARDALYGAGISSEGVDGMVAALLSEEAFGYDDDSFTFDRAFFAETLRSLPALLALDADRIAAIRAELLLGFPAKDRPAAERALGVLFEEAWSDGPDPIGPEQLLAARDRLDQPVEREALRSLLPLLHRKGLIGVLRLARLEKA